MNAIEDFFGGGGLYLAVQMLRTLRLKPNDVVLDLGCGKGATSIFLAKHYGVRVVALDLWTSAEFLNEKFKTAGYADRISAIQMDATQPLPFPEDYFDAIFCMNSFNFYGGSLDFLKHLLKHLKPKWTALHRFRSPLRRIHRGTNRRIHLLFMHSGCRLPMNTSMSFKMTSKNNIHPGWWRDLVPIFRVAKC